MEKGTQICFVCTADEAAHYEAKATEDGRSRSDFIARTLRQAHPLPKPGERAPKSTVKNR